jgi:hypothetical protein
LGSGRTPAAGVADHLAARVPVRATVLLDGGEVVGPVRVVLVVEGDVVRLEVPDDWPDVVAMAAVRPRHDLPVVARVLRPEAFGPTRCAIVEFTEQADRLRVHLWAAR